MIAKAIASNTQACFINVNISDLIQKYIGEGTRIIRELFKVAKSKKTCVIFFDEIDSIGTTRFSNDGNDNEVQRTMLELINQLDGFDSRGNIKILMATNRPDTLDPALIRPGRIDRKIEFDLPDLKDRVEIFQANTRNMNIISDVSFNLLASRCPSATGADIYSICTEASMFAMRDRRKIISKQDFTNGLNKVINFVSRSFV